MGIIIHLPTEPLAARYLKRFGMRRGAYNGANKRRFILFTTKDAPPKTERRHEFDTKRARDQFAIGMLTAILAEKTKNA